MVISMMNPVFDSCLLTLEPLAPKTAASNQSFGYGFIDQGAGPRQVTTCSAKLGHGSGLDGGGVGGIGHGSLAMRSVTDVIDTIANKGFVQLRLDLRVSSRPI
jgi:hypothetical protein